MDTEIPPYAASLCVKSFTVIVGCMTIVSHNVAITTSYADGELFVIEIEPPDTKIKGSPNEPRTFGKVLCGGRASLRPTPSLFSSRQPLLPQNSLVKIHVVLIYSFLITSMALRHPIYGFSEKEHEKGMRGLRRADFRSSKELLLIPSSTCSFAS